VNKIFKSYKLLLLLLTIVILISCTTSKSLYNKGKNHTQMGDYPKAIEKYSMALEKKPDNADYLIARAVAYFHLGELDQAIKDFHKALVLDPENPLAYLYRGKTYYGKGKDDKAIIDFTKVLDLPTSVPLREEAYRMRGKGYYWQCDNQKAVSDFEEALKLNPDNLDTLYYSGKTYMISDKPQKAKKYFTKYLEKMPRDHYVYFDRAFICEKLGQYDNSILDAMQSYKIYLGYLQQLFLTGSNPAPEVFLKEYEHQKALIKREPEDIEVYLSRADAAFMLRKFPEALSDLNIYVSKFPEDYDGYKQRGAVYYFLKQYDKSIADLNRSIEIASESQSTYVYRALTYTSMNEYDKALLDFDKAIELDPTNKMAFYGKGLAFEKQGKKVDAINNFKKFLELEDQWTSKDLIKLAQNKIKALDVPEVEKEEAGNFWLEEKLQEANQKIEQNPDDLEARRMRMILTIGENMNPFQKEEIKREIWLRVIDDCNFVMEHEEADADLYNCRGIAYYKAAEYENAVEDYMKAFELNPKVEFVSPGYGHYDKTISPEEYKDSDEGFEETGDFGELDLINGKFDKPIAFYTVHIEKRPKALRAYYYRGWGYYGKKEYRKAIHDFTKYIDNYPKDKKAYKAYMDRGSAYNKLGQYDKAIEDFSKVIEMRPTDEVAYLWRSEAYLLNKQYHESIADCDKVIERLNEIADNGCKRDGIENPTLEQLEKRIIGFLFWDPEFVGAYFTKAKALDKLGEKAMALNAYWEYIKYGENGAATPKGLEKAKKKIEKLLK